MNRLHASSKGALLERRATGPVHTRLFFRLPLVPVRLMRARQRINDYLHQHGVAEDDIDDVVLAVDEAMTNAVSHSGAQDNLQVSLWFEGRDLRILVKDDGHGFAVGSFDPARTPEVMASGGRGLFLIAQVMDDLELVSDHGLEVRMLKREALPDRAVEAPIDSGLVDVQLLEGTHYRERRLRLIVEELGEAYAALDWEYRFTYANPAAFVLFGKRPEDVLGRTVFELFPTIAEGTSGDAIREAVELGHSAIIEFESAALGGWIECRIYPTGSGISLYLRDIEARRRRESERDEFLDALIASEERFRTLFNSMTEGVALHEVVYRDGRPVDYRILGVNPAYERHTGLSAKQVTGSLASETYGSGEAPFLTEYSRVAETGEALRFESHFEPLQRTYRITAVPVGAGRFATVFEDVSERRARDLEREELLRAAQRSEESFAAVFEESPFAVALTSLPEGSIVRVNRAFEQLFGFERDDLIGRTSPDLGIADDESRAEVTKRFRSQGSVRDFECLRRTASGEERVISLSLSSISLDREEFVLTTVQDVTERAHAEAALRESEQRLRMAQRAAGLGLHDWDIRSGELRWDDRIREIWGVDPGEEVTYDTFIGGVHQDDRDGVQAAIDGAVDPADTGTYDVTFRVIDRADRTERWVRATGEVTFEDGEAIRLAGMIEDVTQRKLEEAATRDAEERLRVEAESARLLLDAIAALSGSLTLNEVLDRLLDVLQSLTGRPRAFVNRVDDERRELTVLAGRGAALPPPGTAISYESLSPTAMGALVDRRVQVLDFEAEPPPAALRRQYRTRLVLFVPLFAGDELIGHIGVDTPGRRVPFEDREIELIKGVAAQAAVAIHNAALFAEVAARERLSTALNEINELIHSTLSAEEVMRRVVERAREAAGSGQRHGGHAPRRGLGRRVRLAGGARRHPREGEHGGGAVHPRGGAERRPVAIEDCDHDDRCIAEVQRRFGVRAVLCIPLVARDEVVGVIFFNHHSGPVKIEGRTIEFADKLAVAVSSALENARLYEEQQFIAVTLQESLIHPPPEVPGLDVAVRSLPAHRPELVGGDFSDLFMVEDGQVVVVIGDVAGKGIRAAGLTETIRSTVRAFASIDVAPAFILRKSNEVLARREPGQPFVTALLCLLDPASGDVTMASAGHPPPVHVSSEGSRLVDLSFGMPLGTMAGDYLPHHIKMAHGDHLVLFTDGVVDARRGNEFFGEERLLAAVDALRGASAKQMAEGLAEAALAFGGSLRDDLHITVVRLC